MPQLNFYTFFNSHFYFSLAFCIAYILLLAYILPKIALILKFRAKYPFFIQSSLNESKTSSQGIQSFSYTPAWRTPQLNIKFLQTKSSLQTFLKYNRSFQYSSLERMEGFLSKSIESEVISLQN